MHNYKAFEALNYLEKESQGSGEDRGERELGEGGRAAGHEGRGGSSSGSSGGGRSSERAGDGSRGGTRGGSRGGGGGAGGGELDDGGAGEDGRVGDGGTRGEDDVCEDLVSERAWRQEEADEQVWPAVTFAVGIMQAPFS